MPARGGCGVSREGFDPEDEVLCLYLEGTELIHFRHGKYMKPEAHRSSKHIFQGYTAITDVVQGYENIL